MGTPLRVLVIEDSEDDVALVVRELQRGGYDLVVRRVDTAAAMRTALEQDSWDIIISDYAMPRFSAPAALTLYQELALDVPFIIVSGTIGEETAVAAMKAGAHDYLTKGKLARLVPAIQRELREAEGRRARKGAKEALRQSEARKRAILESALDCIITIDHEGRILEFNPAAEKTFGYARSEVLGREMAEVVIPPSLRERHRRGLAHYLATGEGPALGKLIEMPAMRADGTEFPAELFISRILLEGPPMFTGYLRDITERKQAQENRRALNEELRQAALQLEAKVEDRTRALQKANAQLEEAMRRAEEASRHKSEFLANMSHELRTPLNAVIGFSEVLQQQGVGPLNAKQVRYVGHIHQSGKHLLQLINDILDLAKVEAGRFILEPQTLPVATTLEDILVIARGLGNKKAQTLSAEIAPDLPPLRADPVRFKQICFNLLSNAVKFTPEQGQITLVARRAPGAPDALELRVTDSGIGIRPEDLPRLFQEFVQLEATATKRHEGTGLGLALTKRLVEMHGGQIWAESAGEGRGSTFTVVLPFTGPAAAAEAGVPVGSGR